MKKRIIKKGWLLGLLAGLLLLVGEMPAMAYTLAAHFDCSSGNSVNGYTLGNGDVLTYNSTNIDLWAKYQFNSGIPTWEEGDPSSFIVTSNSWTANTSDLPEYVLFKGGSLENCNNGGYVYLYKLDGFENNTVVNPFTMTWTSDSNVSADVVLPSSPGLSHISFYNQTAVPIPGTVWLLSSGLGLLFIRRRRQG